MAQGFKVRFWGDYACFTRPELKTERYSYDIPTPSAVRGMLESIFWHPGMRWVVDSIRVLNPIQRSSVRRNEISDKISPDNVLKAYKSGKKLSIDRKDYIDQRAASILKDVDYIVEAHFEMTDRANASDSPAKFASMMERRLSKGQCYKQPCFGCREFPAYFEIGQDHSTGFYDEAGTIDLGIMLYDQEYKPEGISPVFFHARMENGVVDLRGRELMR